MAPITRAIRCCTSRRSASSRALIAAGVWQPQPDDPRLFTDVPATSGHRTDLMTYLHYVGELPGLAAGPRWEGPGGWERPATRAWFAELLWRVRILIEITECAAVLCGA